MKQVITNSLIILSTVFCINAQDYEITHETTHHQNHFGWKISGDNNYCAVADPRDSITGYANGSVNIYYKTNDGWGYSQTIVSPAVREYDYFGYSIEMVEDWLAVSSSGDSEMGFMAGAVHVFRNNNNSWHYLQTIRQDSIQEKMNFGGALSFNGQNLFVGAPGYHNCGALFVYTLINGQYKFQQKILNPHPVKMQFGSSIAATNETLFVGAPAQNMPMHSGTVFAYVRDAGMWKLVQEIEPDDEDFGALFGYSLAATDNQLLIGAPHSDVTGTNNEEYYFSGKAYYFRPDKTGNWIKEALFTNPDPDSHDFYGSVIGINNEAFYISCPNDDSETIDDGSLFEVKLSNASWTQQAIPQITQHSNTYFGNHFDVFDNTLVAGLGGNKSQKNRGTVYIYNTENISTHSDAESEKTVRIYPNPASSILVIDNVTAEKYEIKLFTMSGKTVYESSGTGYHKINLHNFSEGVYLVNVSFENKVYTKELVIKRE